MVFELQTQLNAQDATIDSLQNASMTRDSVRAIARGEAAFWGSVGHADLEGVNLENNHMDDYQNVSYLLGANLSDANLSGANSLMPTSLAPTSLVPTSHLPTSLIPTSLVPTSLMQRCPAFNTAHLRSHQATPANLTQTVLFRTATASYQTNPPPA